LFKEKNKLVEKSLDGNMTSIFSMEGEVKRSSLAIEVRIFKVKMNKTQFMKVPSTLMFIDCSNYEDRNGYE